MPAIFQNKLRFALVIGAMLTVMLVTGFFYVALHNFPVNPQPVQKELPRALFLPDTH